MGGAGQHKDKKKAEKQGDFKHKKSPMPMESALRDKEDYRAKRKALDDLGRNKDVDQKTVQQRRLDLDKEAKQKGMSENNLKELSTEKLAQYKKASGADAKKADADGDYARGDKRFKGINRATRKQFDNDLKKYDQKDVKEAGMYTKPGRPGAYDDDYRSSVSGMGKKDSIAYQQDGGANDEGEADTPYQAAQDKPVLKGYYFYNVQPGQEDTAGMYGVKQTKSGKWAKAKYSTSGRSFDMQKDSADKEFGPGKWWAPK
jgi:hypothetical protein